MQRETRSNLVAGILLIAVGSVLLLGRLLPAWFAWLSWESNWPLLVMGVGVLFLFLGALTQTPPLAVPAFIIGGIGGILYWQNNTGNWESWSYIWALIPGFVGLGVIVSGLMAGTVRESLREGTRTILVSLVMFAIIGSFLGAQDFDGLLLPGLVVLAGVIILLETILGRTR